MQKSNQGVEVIFSAKSISTSCDRTSEFEFAGRVILLIQTYYSPFQQRFNILEIKSVMAIAAQRNIFARYVKAVRQNNREVSNLIAGIYAWNSL